VFSVTISDNKKLKIEKFLIIEVDSAAAHQKIHILSPPPSQQGKFFSVVSVVVTGIFCVNS
jgi:hypothetical protein